MTLRCKDCIKRHLAGYLVVRVLNRCMDVVAGWQAAA